MVNAVIFCLVLSLTSTRGRVAFKETIPDISENFINSTDKQSFEIHIDVPNYGRTNEVESSTVKTSTENVNSNIIPTVSTTESNDNVINNDKQGEVYIDLPTIRTTDIDNTTTEVVKSDTTPTAVINETAESSTVPSKDSTENGVNEVLPELDCGVPLILTKYIKEGRLKQAREASKVDQLDDFLGVESYTGFVTVNETYDSNVFFWYIPVNKKPVNETPWIIWLQGGPGASSLTGLFDELGPFHVTPDQRLVRNPFSWHQNHSLLFIDNPVGTGYSHTNSTEGYVTDMETYGAHLYSTVKQFLQVFPELRTAPLYIAGESYAGKYVPALAMNIHRHKDEENINLQGLITGNAYVDPAMISQMERTFYNFGLLEAEQIELIKPLLDAVKKDIENNDSNAAKGKWNRLISVLLMLTHQRHAYNFLADDVPVGKFGGFLSEPRIRKALHVGNLPYVFINMTVNMKLNGDFLVSTKWMYEELLTQYRVLTYCGQLDQMLSCVMTSENYRTWNWNGSAEFLQAIRYPFLYKGHLAGYHKSGGHLTEVVIRGAGHMAAMDAPGPTQSLVTLWTHQKSLGRMLQFEGKFIANYINLNSSSTQEVIHYL